MMFNDFIRIEDSQEIYKFSLVAVVENPVDEMQSEFFFQNCFVI